MKYASEFPTRNYPYERSVTKLRLAEEAGLESAGLSQEWHGLLPSADKQQLFRFVIGVDQSPVPFSTQDMDALLHDPFATLLLKRNVFPLSLREILLELDACNSEEAAVPDQMSFLVAEGGDIPWTEETRDVPRGFRLAITRANSRGVGILISSSALTQSTSDDAFLQLIGWDDVRKVFHYYERRQGTWVWAGDSWTAFDERARGKGPFDSHVNGSLVMKELKSPWSHWHSEASTINIDALAPHDPFRNDPLFINRSKAQVLENFVKAGIGLWTQHRIHSELSSDSVHPRKLLQHILTTTTVNLTSTHQQSSSINAQTELILPGEFFLNTDALFNELELLPSIRPISVSGQLYLKSIEYFEFRREATRVRGDTGQVETVFREAGDVKFAFVIPEFAFEDRAVLRELLFQRFITPRFAICLLMVDFTNPVFSTKRAQLLKHFPEISNKAEGEWEIEQPFVANIENALSAETEISSVEDSPEYEFLKRWNRPAEELIRSCEDEIESYFSTIQAKAETLEGFFEFVRLSESRRLCFRRRKLNEFDLTVPRTNLSNELMLEMTPEGEVRSI